MKALTIPGSENAKGRLAQPRRLLQHRVEDRGEIARRAVDDPQHLGGRGLLLQGLARLGDQPRILHRDHRLRREVLQQCNLLLSEWANFLSTGYNAAQQSLVFPQRHEQHSAYTREIERSPEPTNLVERDRVRWRADEFGDIWDLEIGCSRDQVSPGTARLWRGGLA